LQATAVVAPGVSEPVPVLESTEVATPSRPVVADNNVLANPTITDEPPITTPVTIQTIPSAPPVVGAALTPKFGGTTATADGFTVSISNYDSSYEWAGMATASGKVSIDNTGLVTVTGVAAGTSSTATIRTTKQNTVDGANTVTAISLTCATGGICKVRDIGPGGGIVFYVATTPFTCGEDLKVTCTYLEAAITTGTGTSSWTPDTKAQWGCYGTFITGTSLEIGTGRANTKMITGQGCKGTDNSVSAASIAAAYNGGGKTDWFLPSRKELNALCLEFFNDPNSKYVGNGWWTAYQLDGCRGRQSAVTSATNVTPGWSFASGNYWSSSENVANNAWTHYFISGLQFNDGKALAYYVRPVRAF
jgi:hypothetical protein